MSWLRIWRCGATDLVPAPVGQSASYSYRGASSGEDGRLQGRPGRSWEAGTGRCSSEDADRPTLACARVHILGRDGRLLAKNLGISEGYAIARASGLGWRGRALRGMSPAERRNADFSRPWLPHDAPTNRPPRPSTKTRPTPTYRVSPHEDAITAPGQRSSPAGRAGGATSSPSPLPSLSLISDSAKTCPAAVLGPKGGAPGKRPPTRGVFCVIVWPPEPSPVPPQAYLRISSTSSA